MLDCGVFIFAFQVSIQVKCPKSGRGSRGRFQNANFYVLMINVGQEKRCFRTSLLGNGFVLNCFHFSSFI